MARYYRRESDPIALGLSSVQAAFDKRNEREAKRQEQEYDRAIRERQLALQQKQFDAQFGDVEYTPGVESILTPEQNAAQRERARTSGHYERSEESYDLGRDTDPENDKKYEPFKIPRLEYNLYADLAKQRKESPKYMIRRGDAYRHQGITPKPGEDLDEMVPAAEPNLNPSKDTGSVFETTKGEYYASIGRPVPSGVNPNDLIRVNPPKYGDMEKAPEQKNILPAKVYWPQILKQDLPKDIDPEMMVKVPDAALVPAKTGAQQQTMPASEFYGGLDKVPPGMDPNRPIPIGPQKLPGLTPEKQNPNAIREPFLQYQREVKAKTRDASDLPEVPDWTPGERALVASIKKDVDQEIARMDTKSRQAREEEARIEAKKTAEENRQSTAIASTLKALEPRFKDRTKSLYENTAMLQKAVQDIRSGDAGRAKAAQFGIAKSLQGVGVLSNQDYREAQIMGGYKRRFDAWTKELLQNKIPNWRQEDLLKYAADAERLYNIRFEKEKDNIVNSVRAGLRPQKVPKESITDDEIIRYYTGGETFVPAAAPALEELRQEPIKQPSGIIDSLMDAAGLGSSPSAPRQKYVPPSAAPKSSPQGSIKAKPLPKRFHSQLKGSMQDYEREYVEAAKAIKERPDVADKIRAAFLGEVGVPFID